MNYIEQISMLAGELRAPTMVKAAEWVLENGLELRTIVETGTFRGIEGDGNSTLIFAMLAKQVGGYLTSVDNSEEQIEKARMHIAGHGVSPYCGFVESDSVFYLSNRTQLISLLYADSYDHFEKDPIGGQLHQLAEVGAAYGKLIAPCAVLLDDNIESDGGKTRLSSDFLKRRGWTLLAEGYQLLFVREK